MANDNALRFQRLDVYRVAKDLALLAASLGAMEAPAAGAIQELAIRFKRMLWKLRGG